MQMAEEGKWQMAENVAEDVYVEHSAHEVSLGTHRTSNHPWQCKWQKTWQKTCVLSIRGMK
jgi:hypothetical protein